MNFEKKHVGRIAVLVGLIFYSAMAYTLEYPVLPGSVNGWTMAGHTEINTHDALYNYIDGGAELYISYGFKSAVSYRYTKPGEPDVRIELFDLGTAADAFGVYSQTRDKDEQEFGQGSYYISGALFFWKNNYWVSLVTEETTDESVKLLRTLAAHIDSMLPETGEKPALISMLPAGDLVSGGYLYFHHYVWLNSYYFLATDNLLNISDHTPAVLAKYGAPDSRLYLLLVQYPDSTSAASAYDEFGRHFFPEGLEDNSIMLEDGTWMSAYLKSNILVGVFNGKSKEKTCELLDKVVSELY